MTKYPYSHDADVWCAPATVPSVAVATGRNSRGINEGDVRTGGPNLGPTGIVSNGGGYDVANHLTSQMDAYSRLLSVDHRGRQQMGETT